VSLSFSEPGKIACVSTTEKKSHGRADIAKQDAIGQRARTQALLRFSNNDSIDV
jgi:hypothetical protein